MTTEGVFMPQYPVEPERPQIEPVEDRFAAPQQEGFVPAPEPRDDGFSDILEVTEEDIMGTEGVALPDEEDNEDLFSAPEEDMGGLFPGVSEERQRRPTPRSRLRRTAKPYYPPPSTFQGIR